MLIKHTFYKHVLLFICFMYCFTFPLIFYNVFSFFCFGRCFSIVYLLELLLLCHFNVFYFEILYPIFTRRKHIIAWYIYLNRHYYTIYITYKEIFSNNYEAITLEFLGRNILVNRLEETERCHEYCPFSKC